MTGDMPTIGSNTYGASNSTFVLGGHGGLGMASDAQGLGLLFNQQAASTRSLTSIMDKKHFPLNQENTMAAHPARRLVQVFIADPDENVPLNKSLIYSGEQKFTDATDQELYFEIDIKTILEAYNAQRVQFVNKKVKERTEFLEPVKIRDLKMVVVTVAAF